MINKVSRQVVLNTLIKHETLTINDIADPGNLGMRADAVQLQSTLDQLVDAGLVTVLDGAHPATYTITSKGIEEGERLKNEPSSTGYSGL
ncbi:MAG: hypothetical protein ACXWV0_08305 [Flavisolibacter sp.]